MLTCSYSTQISFCIYYSFELWYLFYKSYIKLRFNCITNEDQKALNADIFSPVDFIIRCHLNQPTSDYDPNYVRFLSYFNSLMQLYNNRFLSFFSTISCRKPYTLQCGVRALGGALFSVSFQVIYFWGFIEYFHYKFWTIDLALINIREGH